MAASNVNCVPVPLIGGLSPLVAVQWTILVAVPLAVKVTNALVDETGTGDLQDWLRGDGEGLRADRRRLRVGYVRDCNTDCPATGRWWRIGKAGLRCRESDRRGRIIRIDERPVVYERIVRMRHDRCRDGERRRCTSGHWRRIDGDCRHLHDAGSRSAVTLKGPNIRCVAL